MNLQRRCCGCSDITTAQKWRNVAAITIIFAIIAGLLSGGMSASAMVHVAPSSPSVAIDRAVAGFLLGTVFGALMSAVTIAASAGPYLLLVCKNSYFWYRWGFQILTLTVLALSALLFAGCSLLLGGVMPLFEAAFPAAEWAGSAGDIVSTALSVSAIAWGLIGMVLFPVAGLLQPLGRFIPVA